MDCFQSKVAVVTGGASGIGKALCEEMGRRGALVVVADINLKGADEVASAISANGGQTRAVHLDVKKKAKIKKIINDTVDRHGRLDYMFNNAGIATLGEVRHMNREQWQNVIDINFNGVLYGTTAAYEVMVKQGFGHIINTSSQAGLYPIAATTSYGMTKHGVVGLSTSLRAEGAALGVKVSVVCPGPVQTNIVESATVIKINKQATIAKMPNFLSEKPDSAARIILKGVARNQAIIVFPFLARLLWWLHRINPDILVSIGRMGILGMRRYPEES